MDQAFFLLSKIAWILLSPSNLLLILMVIGTGYLVFQRTSTARTILIPTALAAFALLAYPIGDFLIQPLEKRFPILSNNQLPKQIDGIIILGGGEDLPRSLSWHQPQIGLAGDRYIAAKKLADIYPQAPIIFSGGSGLIKLQGVGTEAHLATQLLTELDIPKDRLIIESHSRNTYENFRNLSTMLPKENGSYLLITSAFHMPRAVGIARKLSIDVIPYPVDFRSNNASIRSWDFDTFDHLKTLEPAWKEWIGLTVYYLTGKTKNWFPKPYFAPEMTGASQNP